ncbi:MAG: hypothetical protein R3B06_00235 [Kofleriaceae bacterium]
MTSAIQTATLTTMTGNGEATPVAKVAYEVTVDEHLAKLESKICVRVAWKYSRSL